MCVLKGTMSNTGKFFLTAVVAVAGVSGYLAYNTGHADKSKLLEKAVNEKEENDRRAIDGFIGGLDALFDVYISRVPKAVESKPDWRTAWNMMTGDKAEAEKIVSEHFNREIFNKNDDGKTSWDDISAKLYYELETNRNKLSLEVGKILGNNKFPEKKTETDAVGIKTDGFFSGQEKAVSLNFIVSGVAGIIAEEFTRISVAYGLGTTFTAVGTASGSIVPGLGTAVGLGVGFVSGYAVQSYFENRNNKKISDSMVAALKKSLEKIKSDYRRELYGRIKTDNNGYRTAIKELWE